MRKRVVLTGVLLMVVAVSFSQVKELTGFEIPDYDKENNLKSILSGDSAVPKGEDEITISNLKINSYDAGEINMIMTAPHCIYNKKTRIAKSKSRIKIDRKDMVITGEDFEYDSKSKIFKINKDVKVVLTRPDNEKISPIYGENK